MQVWICPAAPCGNLQYVNRRYNPANMGETILESIEEEVSLGMIMDKIALVLAIIGGLNWGSIGIFGFDLVAFAFGGSNSAISRVIYTLVGLAAIWCISLLFRESDAVEDKA